MLWMLALALRQVISLDRTPLVIILVSIQPARCTAMVSARPPVALLAIRHSCIYRPSSPDIVEFAVHHLSMPTTSCSTRWPKQPATRWAKNIMPTRMLFWPPEIGLATATLFWPLSSCFGHPLAFGCFGHPLTFGCFGHSAPVAKTVLATRPEWPKQP